MNPPELRVYLPFLLNEPKPQRPTEENISPAHILDHKRATFYLHPIQVRLAKTAFADANKILFNILRDSLILLNPIPLPSFRLLNRAAGGIPQIRN